MNDLRSWFEQLPGQWQLTREISSGDQFVGNAMFSAHDSVRLLLEETGRLELANGQSVTASRQWLWSLSDDTLLVEFAENPPRAYHQIPLVRTGDGWQGEADHLCIDDTYDGAYFVGENQMKIAQKVHGPNKDYEIVSVYKRVQSK